MPPTSPVAPNPVLGFFDSIFSPIDNLFKPNESPTKGEVEGDDGPYWPPPKQPKKPPEEGSTPGRVSIMTEKDARLEGMLQRKREAAERPSSMGTVIESSSTNPVTHGMLRVVSGGSSQLSAQQEFELKKAKRRAEEEAKAAAGAAPAAVPKTAAAAQEAKAAQEAVEAARAYRAYRAAAREATAAALAEKAAADVAATGTDLSDDDGGLGRLAHGGVDAASRDDPKKAWKKAAEEPAMNDGAAEPAAMNDGADNEADDEADEEVDGEEVKRAASLWSDEQAPALPPRTPTPPRPIKARDDQTAARLGRLPHEVLVDLVIEACATSEHMRCALERALAQHVHGPESPTSALLSSPDMRVPLLVPLTVRRVSRSPAGVGASPVGRSWRQEWVDAMMERGKLNGDEYSRSMFESGGVASIERIMMDLTVPIQSKVDSGWSREHAEAYTLIGPFLAAPLAAATRERSPRYAACMRALCEALADQAKRLTAPAPPVYINLTGKQGLAAEDPAWDVLRSPKAQPGLRFVTDGLGKAFLPTPNTFPDDKGFCVVMSRGGRDVYELQDSDVVCLRSAPTDANGCHSLIPTSGGGAHALPPFATVTLEKVMQPGEWEVCGQHVKRRLLMVGVTLSDDAAQKPSNRRAIYAGVAQLSPRGPAELSYAELPAAPLDLTSESASEIVSKIVPRELHFADYKEAAAVKKAAAVKEGAAVKEAEIKSSRPPRSNDRRARRESAATGTPPMNSAGPKLPDSPSESLLQKRESFAKQREFLRAKEREALLNEENNPLYNPDMPPTPPRRGPTPPPRGVPIAAVICAPTPPPRGQRSPEEASAVVSTAVNSAGASADTVSSAAPFSKSPAVLFLGDSLKDQVAE